MFILESLPNEIIVKILYHLFVDDALDGTATFKAVCSANPLLKNICLSSPVLRYQLALNALGMVDGDSHLDSASKLAELNRHESSWRALSAIDSDNVIRRTTVHVPFRASHIYDLSAGIYLLGECKSDALIRETHVLRVLDLRTLDTAASEKRPAAPVWPEITVNAEIVDIGFCLHEFDLLAVVGQRQTEDLTRWTIVIFLLELSTGRPHPYAIQPELVVGEALRDWGKMSIMMEIVGSKLVLLMSWRILRIAPAAHDCLIVLNWQKGHLIFVSLSLLG